MSKQIKIGLDKTPAPVTKQFTQLVDIEGTKLFDAAGNPLVTEEEAALTQFTSSQNALSVQVNNTDIRSIPIIEQFAQTSDVSSSLLGVPRSEEQLSLFSDVATYGLDEEQWNEYVFSGARVPEQWYKKDNPVYGRREQPSFNEGSTEQALYLKAYPSQYSFPEGPIEQQESAPTPGFIKYMNFIGLGRYLYDLFVGEHPEFAYRYFLDPTCAYVVNADSTPLPMNLLLTGDAVFDGNGNFHDVEYGKPTLQESFDGIERWTYFFDQIKAGEAKFPLRLSQATQDFTETDDYRKIIDFATNFCIPGGTSTYDVIAVLESKRAFRYQPGRVSGFTFGSRMASEASTTSNFLEWGCSNDTDEYMFQLRGSQFNIVRRSTIKMPDELLTRQGLSEDDQSSEPLYPKGIGNKNALWETVIPRSKWNGDALLGTGDSGYILSFEDVTMYKIEFSWYGAIGAKFYAYIPAGNGEARWVLLHTFIIENGLGQPVLRDPNFKFKYLLYSGDQRNVKSPIYLYKYGSSYYIDGGDEGTTRLNTTTVPRTEFQTRSPLLGAMPKNNIINGDGIPVANGKKAYPIKVSVSTNKTCRIDIEEVGGSPDGMHFNFSPSIKMNGVHPLSRQLDFQYDSDSQISIVQPSNPAVTGTIAVSNGSASVTGTNTQFNTLASGSGGVDVGDSLSISGVDYQVKSIESDTALTLSSNYDASGASGLTTTVVKRLNPEDDYGKIIADGVYGVYVNTEYSNNGRSTNILRRTDNTYNLASGIVRDSIKVDGSLLDPLTSPTFTGRISNYHTIVASTKPIVANSFKIHFLNPSARHTTFGNRHFADFAVAVVPYPPNDPTSGNGDDQKVQFEFTNNQYKDFDINEYPYVEYTHDETFYDQRLKGETREVDLGYGQRLGVDPRIRNPIGTDSGFLSTVEGEVKVVDYQIASVTDGEGDFSGFKKVTFSGNLGPADALIKFDASGNPLSEVGTGFLGTGKFYRTTVTRPTDGSAAFVYVDSGNGTTGQDIAADLAAHANNAGEQFVQTKNLTLKDDWQAVSYDSNNVERFSYRRFSVSQAIRFNDQPLYPVFALQDFAKVHCVVIEEVQADGTVRTQTPTFITEDSGYNPNISIVTSGTSNSLQAPSAFNSTDRLASLRYDTSTSNPLREGEVLSSFYVEANKPVSINLENVFNVDRKGISRGLVNNKAIYFTATSLDGSPGQAELTLTVKEQ